MSEKKSIILDCGNWPVLFRFCRTTLPLCDALARQYPEFIRHETPLAELDVVFDVAYRSEKKCPAIIHTDGTTLEFKRPTCRLSFNVKSGYGTIRFGVYVDDIQVSLWDTLLEVFIGVSHVLMDNGLLVHSAGLKLSQKGWLLPGKSGSGKSTVAGTFPAPSVLNDEKNVIAMSRETPLLHDVPLSVHLRGEALRVPLAGILFLHRLEKNRRQAQAEGIFSQPAVAIARNLLSHVLPPIGLFSETTRDIWLEKVLAVCADVASRVSGYRLCWNDELVSTVAAFFVNRQDVI